MNKKKIRNWINKIKDKYLILSHIMLVITIGIINLISLYNGVNFNFVTTQLKFTNLIYILSVILVILKFENKCKNIKFLVELGNLSFGIYFIHTYFIKIYKHISILDCYYIDIIIGTIIVALVSYFTIRVFKKITKNKFDKILGF